MHMHMYMYVCIRMCDTWYYNVYIYGGSTYEYTLMRMRMCYVACCMRMCVCMCMCMCMCMPHVHVRVVTNCMHGYMQLRHVLHATCGYIHAATYMRRYVYRTLSAAICSYMQLYAHTHTHTHYYPYRAGLQQRHVLRRTITLLLLQLEPPPHL